MGTIYYSALQEQVQAATVTAPLAGTLKQPSVPINVLAHLCGGIDSYGDSCMPCPHVIKVIEALSVAQKERAIRFCARPSP